MNLELFLLIIVVITALAFDFTNGFHDTGNAMATSISSGALSPKAAVALSAALNLAGAFLSTAVAATIAKDLVDAHLVTLELVFAGLVGGIVGAMIAAVGGHGVIWSGLVSRVVIASLVSLAHGTNDAQKTMGVIFLALMSYGAVSKTAALPPLWVIVCCAVAMGAGTYVGGWRVIRTLGKGLVEIKPPRGMAAESSSAAVILLSANFGYALSTTPVATGSVLGSGVGKPGAEVRWAVAGWFILGAGPE